VTINCGAIPEQLLESELFGHEKGAFTGAHVARAGRLEMAEGGVVLLDEVGELPASLQVKLLRFLQDHEIERVGGREVMKLDVRVIAATSRNLEEEAKHGRFRQDLYYRLGVITLRLPPLRERPEDIYFLAQYFLDRNCSELGRGRLSFTPGAKLAIQQHAWPGNVRELAHRVQKAVLMSSGRLLEPEDLEIDTVKGPRRISLRQARQEADRQTIRDALQLTGGNISKAAELLGISRPSLHELLTKLRVNAQDYKQHAARGEV
jgi:two-component system NtrC family response regulator